MLPISSTMLGTYERTVLAECRHARQEVIGAHGQSAQFSGLDLIRLGQNLRVQVLPLGLGLEHVEEADFALRVC